MASKCDDINKHVYKDEINCQLDIAKYLPYTQASSFLGCVTSTQSLIKNVTPPKDFIIDVQCIDAFENQYHKSFDKVRLFLNESGVSQEQHVIYRHSTVYQSITDLIRHNDSRIKCIRKKSLETLMLIIKKSDVNIYDTLDAMECPKNLIWGPITSACSFHFMNKTIYEIKSVPVGIESIRSPIYQVALRLATSEQLVSLRVLHIDQAIYTSPYFGHMQSLIKLHICIIGEKDIVKSFTCPPNLIQLHITFRRVNQDMNFDLSDMQMVKSIRSLSFDIKDYSLQSFNYGEKINWPSKLKCFSINSINTFFKLKTYPQTLQTLVITLNSNVYLNEIDSSCEYKYVEFGGDCKYKVLKLLHESSVQVLKNFRLPSCVKKLVVPCLPNILDGIVLPRTLEKIQVIMSYTGKLHYEAQKIQNPNNVKPFHTFLGISESDIYGKRKWHSTTFKRYKDSEDDLTSTITFTSC